MEYTPVLRKIRKIIRSINLESKRIQKNDGISIPQLLCLNYLNTTPNYQSSHKDIASYLELNSSTVTGIIDRLQKKGLVGRAPNRDDRRTTMVFLTSQGEKLVRNAPPLLQERLTSKLETLSENKLLEINRALDLIIEYLGIEGIEASPMLTDGDELLPDQKTLES